MEKILKFLDEYLCCCCFIMDYNTKQKIVKILTDIPNYNEHIIDIKKEEEFSGSDFGSEIDSDIEPLSDSEIKLNTSVEWVFT